MLLADTGGADLPLLPLPSTGVQSQHGVGRSRVAAMGLHGGGGCNATGVMTCRAAGDQALPPDLGPQARAEFLCL